METWQPISKTELEQIIKEELDQCTPEQKALFAKYKVDPYKASIIRNGTKEDLFIVAVRDAEVMYYEDVEEGFNFSLLNEDGSIKDHWCNQDELKHALLHWLK